MVFVHNLRPQKLFGFVRTESFKIFAEYYLSNQIKSNQIKSNQSAMAYECPSPMLHIKEFILNLIQQFFLPGHPNTLFRKLFSMIFLFLLNFLIPWQTPYKLKTNTGCSILFIAPQP